MKRKTKQKRYWFVPKVSKKQPVDLNRVVGLCNRCEARTRFRESGHGPRSECGDLAAESCCCYMYKPVLPVIQTLAPGYRKDRVYLPTLLRSRMRGTRVATPEDVVAVMKEMLDGEYLPYWKPLVDMPVPERPTHDYPYICASCASRLGARVPAERRGITVHPATCPYCRRKKVVAAITDWIWPKKTGIPFVWD